MSSVSDFQALRTKLDGVKEDTPFLRRAFDSIDEQTTTKERQVASEAARQQKIALLQGSWDALRSRMVALAPIEPFVDIRLNNYLIQNGVSAFARADAIMTQIENMDVADLTAEQATTLYQSLFRTMLETLKQG